MTASQKAWDIYSHNTQRIDDGVNDIKFKKLDWIRTKFEFDGLRDEEQYRFIVRLANAITFAESKRSQIIMPMIQPGSGKIDSVRQLESNNTLFVDYSYPEQFCQNQSMNPLTFSVTISPWPGT